MLQDNYEIADNGRNSRRIKCFVVCGVLLLSATSSFWMLSAFSLNNHECFVSITAREMLRSGNWIMPTCNGELRLQKTPLSYWLVAVSAKITGQVDEFTTRLPSAVFAFLSVAAILYFVNQWLSFRIAILSSAVWVTSLGYIRYSHNARPEMALTFFIMLCFLSFYSAVNEKNRKRQIVYMLVFWVSFGLANLAKGPAPLPLVLLPLFFYVAIFRQWKMVPKLLPIMGMIIFLAIILPWPLTIAHKLNWDLGLWKREFIDRFFGTYRSGNRPIYYYLYIMFQFILPWAAFLPMALAAPFYRVWAKKQPAMQFLWLWFVVDLVFLTINGGKRKHYILPSMPAIAILVGILIEDMLFVQKAYTLKYATGVLRKHIVVIIAGVTAALIYVAKSNSQLLADALILGTVTLIITAIVSMLFAKGKTTSGCAAVFVGIVVIVMISYTIFFVSFDYNRYSRDFSRRIAETVPQSSKLVAYGNVSKRSVHYFGRVIPVIKDKPVLYKGYEDGDWIIATSDHLEKLIQDKRFRMVYYKEKAERQGQKDTSGALFHKTAPAVRDDSNRYFQAASISSSH